MKFIFITEENPYPPNTGGKMRDESMIRLLAEVGEVKVLAFSGSEKNVQKVFREKESIWKRVFYPFRTYIVNGYSRNLEKTLKDVFELGAILFASRLAMGKYLEAANRIGYKTILDEHNVESELLIRAVSGRVLRLLELKNAYECRKYEAKFCSQAKLVIATSEHDRNAIKQLSPGSETVVIPNTIDCEVYKESRKKPGNSFVFTGTLSYQPNVEGLNWFLENIFPRLKNLCPMPLPKIIVAGSNPSDSLRARLNRAEVDLKINPPTILPYLDEASVVFVPLLSGSGTRIKILEAMASGRAIVSTEKGAEGLDLRDGEGIILRDDPKEFADAMVSLQSDMNLRRALQKKAIEIAESKFDWKTLRPLMLRALENLK